MPINLHELYENIERAVREIGCVPFRGYREKKQLAQALKILEKKGNAAPCSIHDTNRQRLTIPGATVRYVLGGRGILKSGYSNACPMINLSRGGLAFLASRPAKPGTKVSLIVSFSEKGEPLRLEGRIVYGVAVDIAGYQYRLGIKFQPFAMKRGCNTPEALETIARLERIHFSP